MKADSSVRGFTLLEVMIALTIFVSMALVMSDTASQSTATLLHLQDNTLASMVAENRMTELRLSGLPPQGERMDQVKMANRDWVLRIRVEKTEFPDTHRVTVDVMDAANKENVVATLASIMGKH